MRRKEKNKNRCNHHVSNRQTHDVSCFNRKPKEKREHREKKGKEKEEREKNVANEKKRKKNKIYILGYGTEKEIVFFN